jgi:hypothetical protein
MGAGGFWGRWGNFQKVAQRRALGAADGGYRDARPGVALSGATMGTRRASLHSPRNSLRHLNSETAPDGGGGGAEI